MELIEDRYLKVNIKRSLFKKSTMHISRWMEFKLKIDTFMRKKTKENVCIDSKYSCQKLSYS